MIDKIKENKVISFTIAFIVALAGFMATSSQLYSTYKENATNLAGNWMIEDKIENAKLNRYIGMSCTYKIFICQEKNKISGKGEKVFVNGKDLPFSQRVPITIEGIIDGEIVNVSYTETGSKRATTGVFNWNIEDKGNKVGGTFSGTASDATGKSYGYKLK